MKTQNPNPLINNCPVCHKEPASTHPIIGILPCESCNNKRRQSFELPDHPVEFTSAEIKEGRRKYFKSALQPWRHHEASSEFIEAYPKESQEIFTEKERKKAKPVWSDLPGAKQWRNSK